MLCHIISFRSAIIHADGEIYKLYKLHVWLTVIRKLILHKLTKHEATVTATIVKADEWIYTLMYTSIQMIITIMPTTTNF